MRKLKRDLTRVSSEPPLKKKKKNPTSRSFLALPEAIILNILARISRLYYPKLSLVCKTFSSLVISHKLYVERFQLKTYEELFFVRLKLPTDNHPRQYTLWTKPDQNLTKKNKKSTRLVPIPSCIYPYSRVPTVKVGSKRYGIRLCHPPSPIMWVRNEETSYENFWREASRMRVARESPNVCKLNKKIYVMGGCSADESTNWAEVFDLKTQKWESLPDPGVKLRSSLIKKIEVNEKKIYVTSTRNKDYVYIPKEGKWDVEEKLLPGCVIENVEFCFDIYVQRCLWYNTKDHRWRKVRGLGKLNKKYRVVEAANYRGKLLLLWEKLIQPPRCQEKKIWCAMIAIRKSNGKVWGKIEWVNVVLTVPKSCVFLRSRQALV